MPYHIPVKLRRMKALKALQGSKSTPTLTYVLTAVAVTGGFLFGYNTTVVSGALVIIKHVWVDVDDWWQSFIVSITAGVAAIFALISGWVNEVWGRRPGLIISSILFIIGPIVCGTASTKETLLVGRVVIGIAIGFASASVPHYVAECAPPHIRGRLVTQFQLLITFGILTASVTDALLNNLDTSVSWRYMLGFPAIVGLIQLIGFLFMPESPRWLATHNRIEESKNVLLRITANSEIANVEFEDIMEIHAENLAERALLGNQGLVITMLKEAHIRKGLLISGLLQMFQQLSGVNTVMYYSTTILIMGGTDQKLALWLNCVISAVNFIMTFLGLYLIEKIGRKMLLLLSNFLVIISLIILGSSFVVISAESRQRENNQTLAGNMPSDSCSQLKNCDQCSYNQSCGFCYSNQSLKLDGICITYPLLSDSEPSTCPLNWTDHSMAVGFCPTNEFWLPIVGMVLFLCSFSIGFGPVPWTLTAETFPNFCRSAGNAFATTVNWLFNLLVSLTFLQLAKFVTREGVFFLYAAISLAGFVIFLFVLPETRGKSLEKLTNLLKRPLFSELKFKIKSNRSEKNLQSSPTWMKNAMRKIVPQTKTEDMFLDTRL